MQVHDASQLDVCVVGCFEPLGDFVQDGCVRASGVVEAGCVDEVDCLVVEGCGVDAYCGGACLVGKEDIF